nr:uncharacterized protein LOC112016141 [Quercus suber]
MVITTQEAMLKVELRNMERMQKREGLAVDEMEVQDYYMSMNICREEAMLKSELLNLERMQKREGVDMTYLKNVILKLLGTGEVEALLPVIGILLQSSPEELLELSSVDLISKGNAYINSCQNVADKFLNKVFKVLLGRGFYGECLGVRVDGNSNLSDEIGKQLGVKSAAAGLRPIGAVVYMQRNNLKMCLRSIDSATDTSEVAKAYGGGGSPSSSSFIIRMDEYNQWLSVNSS